MKQVLNLQLHSSTAPQLLTFVSILFLTALLAPRKATAQEAEPPFNPCVSALSLGPSCLDGSRSCNYVQPNCSPGYCWSNGVPSIDAGIPPGGLVQNKVIDIGGVYTITKNVTFKDCRFRMSGDARINISPVGAAPINVTFDNCDLYGCTNMWQGIFVDASALTNVLNFNFFDGNIEDAYKGISLDEGNGNQLLNYQITNNTFRNNHIGITNLRLFGAELNAIIRRNQFFQTANLAARVGSLVDDPNLPPLMPGYPLSYAGIKYVGLVTTIGINANGEANLFRCLLNGIITEGIRSNVLSTNNTFERITDRGIWAKQGYLAVINCTFGVEGGIGVLTETAGLLAETNIFGGNWEQGIRSVSNNSALSVRIRNNNQFNIAAQRWTYGIYVERPQALFGKQCIIDGNIFTVTSNPSSTSGLTCIYIHDLANAADEAEVSWNNISINSTQGGVDGITIRLSNSDNFNVHDNTIQAGTLVSTTINRGIVLQPFANQNLSTGHVVKHNNVSGIVPATDTFNSINCAFHTDRIGGVDFCDNTVDLTRWGFHFVHNNAIRLRENHINHHAIGLYIVDGAIGLQAGRGNQWSLDPNACSQFAASVEFGNALSSRFIVDEIEEGTALPWIPANPRLNPNPIITNWFHTLISLGLDYCLPGAEAPPTQELTSYEKEAVEGTSALTGAALWDLKRETFTKLLIFSDLRPVGSPEATFFNSLSSTSIASFAQVTQQVRSGSSVSVADQTAFDGFQEAIEQTFENLKALDESITYADPGNLSDSWFSQRAALLQQIALNAENHAILENGWNQQMVVAMQNALAYNTSITATLPFESARKTLNELYIRHLLSQPMTEPLYAQALSLAQQDVMTNGNATEEVVTFLAPCDQGLFRGSEEEGHERGEEHKDPHVTNLTRLQIAPNPTTGLAEVSLPNQDGGLLTVYNSHGQKVKTLSISLGVSKVSIDFGQNPNGFYWIVLTDEKGKVFGTTKVSIIH